MKESIILNQITHYLQLQENLGNLYFVRVGSGGIKTETGKFFKSGKKGAPDILLCLDGKFIGIEVKNEKGKQTESQIDAETRIKKAGGKYFVIRSLDEMMLIINSKEWKKCTCQYETASKLFGASVIHNGNCVIKRDL